MIFVLFGVSAIVFYLARGFPAAFAPWAQYITFRMKPSQIDAIIKAHGFDQPLYIQYWYWANAASDLENRAGRIPVMPLKEQVFGEVRRSLGELLDVTLHCAYVIV